MLFVKFYHFEVIEKEIGLNPKVNPIPFFVFYDVEFESMPS